MNVDQRESELERLFTMAFTSAAVEVDLRGTKLRQPYANDGELARAYAMGKEHGRELERLHQEEREAWERSREVWER